MLPLAVRDDCAQQQGDDSHEVEVPFWAEELVQIHLGDELVYLVERGREKGRERQRVQ